MSNGLKVMIYDTTDVRGLAKQQIKDFTPPALDLLDDVVDMIDLEIGLSTSWWAGGWLYRMTRSIDYMRGFDSWESALHWLTTVEPGKSIAEVQFWGHGSPGKVWMKGEFMHPGSFDHTHGPLLKKLKARLNKDSLIWFRTCSTFTGTKGHRFAKAWADGMGCRIAAHTYLIHPYQSGLHTLKPGEEPSWDLMEGVEEGTADRPTKLKWSKPWAPNTIFCLRSAFPDSW